MLVYQSNNQTIFCQKKKINYIEKLAYDRRFGSQIKYLSTIICKHWKYNTEYKIIDFIPLYNTFRSIYWMT